MAYQANFRRWECKYMLTPGQKECILRAMASHMELDRYGRTTIRNIYFDTDSYRLIRHSLERPVYKEKLRLRSYQRLGPSDTAFVELKKKYQGIVYKRRLAMPEQEAMAWMKGCGQQPPGQIAREIEYFRQYYEPLRPAVFLSYEREAFFCREDDRFRVTFDDTILARREAFSLQSEVWGESLLPPDSILMEIKTAGAIPLWMTQVLTRERIFKTSFSKYGTAYQTMILPQYFKGGFIHVK